MRILTYATVSVLIAVFGYGQYIQISDKENRPLTARIVSTDGTTVTIERTDEKTFTLPISNLSPDSAKLIQIWKKPEFKFETIKILDHPGTTNSTPPKSLYFYYRFSIKDQNGSELGFWGQDLPLVISGLRSFKTAYLKLSNENLPQGFEIETGRLDAGEKSYYVKNHPTSRWMLLRAKPNAPYSLKAGEIYLEAPAAFSSVIHWGTMPKLMEAVQPFPTAYQSSQKSKLDFDTGFVPVMPGSNPPIYIKADLVPYWIDFLTTIDPEKEIQKALALSNKIK